MATNTDPVKTTDPTVKSVDKPVDEPVIPATPVVEFTPDMIAKAQDTNVKSEPHKAHADVHMDNLIKQAEKDNAALLRKQDTEAAQAKVFVDANVPQKLKDNSAKVMQILKDHGMDSQQAEHAHKRLMNELD